MKRQVRTCAAGLMAAFLIAAAPTATPAAQNWGSPDLEVWVSGDVSCTRDQATAVMTLSSMNYDYAKLSLTVCYLENGEQIKKTIGEESFGDQANIRLTMDQEKGSYVYAVAEYAVNHNESVISGQQFIRAENTSWKERLFSSVRSCCERLREIGNQGAARIVMEKLMHLED